MSAAPRRDFATWTGQVEHRDRVEHQWNRGGTVAMFRDRDCDTDAPFCVAGQNAMCAQDGATSSARHRMSACRNVRNGSEPPAREATRESGQFAQGVNQRALRMQRSGASLRRHLTRGGQQGGPDFRKKFRPSPRGMYPTKFRPNPLRIEGKSRKRSPRSTLATGHQVKSQRYKIVCKKWIRDGREGPPRQQ